MPTYNYRCQECKHEFEAQQGMMEEPLKECPECEGYVIRLIGKVNIKFVGSGFYVNDSKKKKQ